MPVRPQKARVRQSADELRILGVAFPIRRYQDGRVVSWYYHGRKRERVTRASESALRKVLEDAAIKIVNGELDVNEIGGVEARAMIAARDVLAPYNISVDVAAREYAAARELLGTAGLLEAVRFYKRHAGEQIKDRTVSQVVVEFLVAKFGLSDEYLGQIKKDLERFGKKFGARAIADVESSEIAAWVDATERVNKKGKKFKPGAARRNQIRNTVATLFAFARTQRYLVRGRETEAEMVPKAKHVRSDIHAFGPEQLRLALELTAQFDRAWLPFLVLGCFAGIRANTLRRLTWSVVKFDRDVIAIPTAKSKISRRYLPPFVPAAKAWLADWDGEMGPITPKEDPRHFLGRLVRRAGWGKWPKNCPRKSFISHRMAILKSAAAVALEANTSEKEIFENYREVSTIAGDTITEAHAKLYFGVVPKIASNITSIQAHLGL